MTKNTWTWIAVVVIFLFGAFAFWGVQKIFTPAPPKIKSDTITVIKHDTTKYKVRVFSYGVHTDTIIVNNTDTLFIAKTFEKSKDTVWVYDEFYKTKFDSIILTDNSDLWFKLNYGITENQLVTAQGRYVNKKPTQIINNNPVIQQGAANQLYVGANLSAFKDGFGLGGRITYKSKRDQLWHVGIDYLPYIFKGPIYSIGTDIKIKL